MTDYSDMAFLLILKLVWCHSKEFTREFITIKSLLNMS